MMVLVSRLEDVLLIDFYSCFDIIKVFYKTSKAPDLIRLHFIDSAHAEYHLLYRCMLKILKTELEKIPEILKRLPFGILPCSSLIRKVLKLSPTLN